MRFFSKYLMAVALLIALGLCLNSAKRFVLFAAENSVQDQIVAKERQELEALKTGDKEGFANLLADDALFLDPRGTGTKAEVVSHVTDFRLEEYSMEDIKFVPLSANSGLIAYKLTQKGNAHGKEFSTKAYASAIWTKRADKWLCIFSQETPAR
jgi:ketosteroid isomerase-like protein